MAKKEVNSDITGSVWKILKQPGDHVDEEDQLLILESMKMEIPVLANAKGTISSILVREGESVAEGQVLAILEV